MEWKMRLRSSGGRFNWFFFRFPQDAMASMISYVALAIPLLAFTSMLMMLPRITMTVLILLSWTRAGPLGPELVLRPVGLGSSQKEIQDFQCYPFCMENQKGITQKDGSRLCPWTRRTPSSPYLFGSKNHRRSSGLSVSHTPQKNLILCSLFPQQPHQP